MRRVSVVASRLTVEAAPRRHLSYTPQHRDINFLFNDCFQIYDHWKKLAKEYNRPDIVETCTPDFTATFMEEAGKFAQNEVFPLYMDGDHNGAAWDPKTGDVKSTPGFKEACESFAAGGWNGVHVPEAYGGQGLPMTFSLVKTEYIATANWSWCMFPGLTQGAINTLLLHGTEEMKQLHVRKMSDGEWLGTMCLTEPHCGTDLGQIKSKAEALDERAGLYKLSGTKIFISCGEHDVGDNIIHIVLAKLPGAPAGVKGISLFLVPKYTEEELKKPMAERKKNIQCVGIEKKMGIHGSPTCQMHMDGNTIGQLIGKKHDGLRQMFTFMNTARLGVGLQAVAHMELALQNSYAYATERRSMRLLAGAAEPDKIGDAIVHHPDVRRMLLTQKAFTEGGRWLLYYCAQRADAMAFSPEKAIQDKMEEEIGFLTPISKGFTTEVALESCSLGMQVFGGHGYIRDHGMEQIYRDCRIASLYEGTTGIQSLDLIGRKVFRDKKFKLLRSFLADLTSDSVHSFKEGGTWQRLAALRLGREASRLLCSLIRLASRIGMKKLPFDGVGAGSVDFLMACGYLTYGRAWLHMGSIAEKKLKGDGLSADDRAFYEGKVTTARFYFDHLFGRARHHIESINHIEKDVVCGKEHRFLGLR